MHFKPDISMTANPKAVNKRQRFSNDGSKSSIDLGNNSSRTRAIVNRIIMKQKSPIKNTNDSSKYQNTKDLATISEITKYQRII